MHKLISVLALTTALMPFCLSAVHAEPAPDFSQCAALRDANAYAKKYKDVMYLVPGKDGWFFRTKQDLRQDYEFSKQGQKLFQALADALRKRGTELVIAYIPTRGMGATAFLPENDPLVKAYDAEKAAKNYADFIEQMNDSGVATVGLPHPSTKQPFFYKADQHWTTFGANEMAKAIAQKIKSMPGYADVAKKEFKTDPEEKVSFKGTFNEALKGMCGLEAEAETDTLTVTSAVGDASDQDALFSEESAPQIVLAGTSNSKKKDNNLNFDGLLQQALSAEVLNVAISGGALTDSMLAYFASDDFQKNPPKFLIWEIPGYYDLKGDGARNLLHQLIPAVYGDCGQDNLVSGSVSLTGGQEKPLVTRLRLKRLEAKETYLSLKFNQKIHDEFTVSFKHKDTKTENFKFKRSKRYPFDGLYFFMPKSEGKLSSVSIKAPENAENWSVEARLCSLPSASGSVARPGKETGDSVVKSQKSQSWSEKLKSFFN